MSTIKFGDTDFLAGVGDMVELQSQTLEVVECIVSEKKMLNIDASELKEGDLKFIKRLGLTISNPYTSLPVALGESVPDNDGHPFLSAVAGFLAADSLDGDDDSSFFSSSSSDDSSSSDSGFSFGGFGGGLFGGGGASESW